MRRVRAWVVAMCILGACGASAALAQSAPQKNPMAIEHDITVDATAITPSKAWSIPGVTEPLQSLHAPLTGKVKTVKIRPGRYMFMTTNFSFRFMVDLDGKLDYDKAHDECVDGRGSTNLLVKCRFIGY
jgi:hypothetical protein